MNSGRYCMETLNTSHQQPPREWGDTTFTSVEDLAELHKAALEAAENSDTIDADLHAALDEKRKLEASGRRETIKRLTALATRISSLESLVDAAHDSADAARKKLHAGLWGGWRWLAGRADAIRHQLVAERKAVLEKNEVFKTASISDEQRNMVVAALVESWEPLRKLDIDPSGTAWHNSYSYFRDVLAFVDEIEKDPSKLTAE